MQGDESHHWLGAFLLNKKLYKVKKIKGVKYKMKKFLIFVGILIFCFITIYLIGNSGNKNIKSSITLNKNLEQKINIEPIKLTGVGQETSKKFKLEGSLYKITSNSPFLLADLLDSKGESLQNLIGEKDFWYTFDYQDNYLLNVSFTDENTRTPWEINIEPITINNNQAIDQFTGTSSKTTGMFNAKAGLKTIRATHSGKGSFIVNLYSEYATKQEITGYNAVGKFNGSKAVQFYTDGHYFFDIEADGDWSVEIEH